MSTTRTVYAVWFTYPDQLVRIFSNYIDACIFTDTDPIFVGREYKITDEILEES